MTEDQRIALRRLRRKVEVLHLDLQRDNDPRFRDAEEMLRLIEMLEKPQTPEDKR